MISKVVGLLKAMLSLFKPSRWGPFTEAYRTSRFDHGFTISWSQGGEDIALLHVLGSITGKYLDIGAHHPTRFSVTRHLYQRGWRGVHVDANQDLAERFKRDRPDEIFINACVGEKQEYEFNIFEETAISTADENWSRRAKENGNFLKRTIQVPGVSARKLILEYGPFNLIVIDVEGMDLEVISSMNLSELPESYKPRFIVVELEPPVIAVLNNPLTKLLQSVNYEPLFVLPMSTVFRRT
jgi:FkbM family methyltransferase